MKATALFAVIAALAVLVGAYSAARHKTERDVWRHESSRLLTKISDLEEKLAKAQDRQPEPASDSVPPQELVDAEAELSSIEAEILDRRAELVQLKSDRLVADEHAKASLNMLRRQVRKTTEIERDLDSLISRRLEIQDHIVEAEEEFEGINKAIEVRQEFSDSLDRKIAELAIRHEVANSRLNVAEAEPEGQTVSELHVAKVKDLGAKDDLAPKTESQTVTTLASDAGPQYRDRSQGLYQFKALNVDIDPENNGDVSSDGPTLSALADGADSDQQDADAWATQQYELGRQLVIDGEQSSGTRKLSDAVLALRAALGEWSKNRDPRRRAAAQSDLCYAQALLGRRQDRIDALEDAARVCRDALTEIEQLQTPVLWAYAQHNLGFALSGIAMIKEDESLWRNAVEAFQKSVEGFEDVGANSEAKITIRRLEKALARLTALRKGP